MAARRKVSLPPEQEVLGVDDLRLLRAVAETGSLVAAARRLGVNHASAWRRLQNLERRLGVRLFERGRRSYAPTPAGEIALSAAERLTQDLDDLIRFLAGQDARTTGLVRLTTTEGLLELIAPALAALAREQPGLRLEVRISNAAFTLTRRDADVALRAAPAPPEHLVARRLAEVATAAYAAPGQLAGRERPGPRDLDWLGPDESLAHLPSSRWLAEEVDAARVVLRASSLTALRAAACAGVGATFLPCFLGDPDARLVRVLPPVEALRSTLWLLTHPDLRRAPRVRAVAEAIEAWVVSQRPLLEGRGESQTGSSRRR